MPRTEQVAIGGMLETKGLILVKVLGVRRGPGVAGLTLSTLGRYGINIVCVVSSSDTTNRENITLALDATDVDQALGLLQGVKEEIQAERIEFVKNCCVISLYGPHFSERPSIAGLMFEALAEGDIDIHAISTSVSTVSCIIDEDDLERAHERLAASFLMP